MIYHRVRDGFDWSITRQGTEQFERGINSLIGRGCRLVPLRELLESSGNSDEKRIAFTFDDGYEDVYRNAFPVLRKLGLTACIFVVTGYVGRYSEWDYGLGGSRRRHLSWEQIKEMAEAGFEFGSHTVNHPDLTRIPRRFVEYELTRSKEALEDKLGRSVDVLSYPFGRYDRYVQEETERLGYQAAYTVCQNSGEEQSRFSQPRHGVYLLDSPLTLKIKLDGGWPAWIEEMKVRIINRFSDWTVRVKGSPDYGKL